jgi:pyruvate dehydrogenase E1 component beta subunit
LDREALFNSVAKTGRCVVVQEGYPFSGVGAEIVAQLQEHCFDLLDAPVLRITNRDVPQPYATNLEKLVMPSAERVVTAARRVLGLER